MTMPQWVISRVASIIQLLDFELFLQDGVIVKTKIVGVSFEKTVFSATEEVFESWRCCLFWILVAWVEFVFVIHTHFVIFSEHLLDSIRVHSKPVLFLLLRGGEGFFLLLPEFGWYKRWSLLFSCEVNTSQIMEFRTLPFQKGFHVKYLFILLPSWYKIIFSFPCFFSFVPDP